MWYEVLQSENHVYLNSVQQVVSGELGRGVSPDTVARHGLPLNDHLNSVQLMASGEYCEGVFPDSVCWTQLRNAKENALSDTQRPSRTKNTTG